MIAYMQASAEELLLLLKKWESDSKRVIATGVIQPSEGFRCVFKVCGLIEVDEATKTFSVGDLAEDFALCEVSYLSVGYSPGEDIDWSQFAHEVVDPSMIEDVAFLRNPDLSTLALLVLKSN
jgi:hypothetical protein